MTGDDLITLVTNAPDVSTARGIVFHAPVQARYEAADLLYLDADNHSKMWACINIVREARA